MHKCGVVQECGTRIPLARTSLCLIRHTFSCRKKIVIIMFYDGTNSIGVRDFYGADVARLSVRMDETSRKFDDVRVAAVV